MSFQVPFGQLHFLSTLPFFLVLRCSLISFYVVRYLRTSPLLSCFPVFEYWLDFARLLLLYDTSKFLMLFARFRVVSLTLELKCCN